MHALMDYAVSHAWDVGRFASDAVRSHGCRGHLTGTCFVLNSKSEHWKQEMLCTSSSCIQTGAACGRQPHVLSRRRLPCRLRIERRSFSSFNDLTSSASIARRPVSTQRRVGWGKNPFAGAGNGHSAYRFRHGDDACIRFAGIFWQVLQAWQAFTISATLCIAARHDINRICHCVFLTPFPGVPNVLQNHMLIPTSVFRPS